MEEYFRLMTKLENIKCILKNYTMEVDAEEEEKTINESLNQQYLEIIPMVNLLKNDEKYAIDIVSELINLYRYDFISDTNFDYGILLKDILKTIKFSNLFNLFIIDSILYPEENLPHFPKEIQTELISLIQKNDIN